MIYKKYLFLASFILGMIIYPLPSLAGNYTVQTNIVYRFYSTYWLMTSMNIVGFNKTHGFSQQIPLISWTGHGSNPVFYDFTFAVPDDGSDWDIVGSVTMLQVENAEIESTRSASFTFSCTTPGTYTGPSLGNILTAANNASIQATTAATTASSANTNAGNAYNAVSNANGNTITAVRDASGTVLSEARQAKTNSESANTNALNAYNTAQTVNTKVNDVITAIADIDTAIVGLNDDNSLIVSAVREPGGTVLDVSKNTKGAVEDVNGNTITAVRDNGGTVLDASRSARDASLDAVNKINTLQTTVNNILTSDNSPPVIKISTLSGARATSGNSIMVVLGVSDNISSDFMYSLDGVNFSPLPLNKTITLPINKPGNNIINIWVKDEAGNTGTDYIIIRKICDNS